jgi:hypothetical protein
MKNLFQGRKARHKWNRFTRSRFMYEFQCVPAESVSIAAETGCHRSGKPSRQSPPRVYTMRKEEKEIESPLSLFYFES